MEKAALERLDMTKSEILKELAKLSPEERQEIRAMLDVLDNTADEEWEDLSEADRNMIEKRLANIAENPESLISWNEFQKRRKVRTLR